MRPRTRFWSDMRQAYTPRLWPSALIACPLSFLLAWLLEPPLWALVAGAVALGVAVGQFQWWLWRRRHPLITADQYLERMRRMARWN